MTDPNDPAFPETEFGFETSRIGLTKREYFAAMAMQGMMTYSPEDMNRWSGVGKEHPTIGDWIASNAVDVADALIAALSKEKP